MVVTRNMKTDDYRQARNSASFAFKNDNGCREGKGLELCHVPHVIARGASRYRDDLFIRRYSGKHLV